MLHGGGIELGLGRKTGLAVIFFSVMMITHFYYNNDQLTVGSEIRGWKSVTNP